MVAQWSIKPPTSWKFNTLLLRNKRQYGSQVYSTQKANNCYKSFCWYLPLRTQGPSPSSRDDSEGAWRWACPRDSDWRLPGSLWSIRVVDSALRRKWTRRIRCTSPWLHLWNRDSTD